MLLKTSETSFSQSAAGGERRRSAGDGGGADGAAAKRVADGAGVAGAVVMEREMEMEREG